MVLIQVSRLLVSGSILSGIAVICNRDAATDCNALSKLRGFLLYIENRLGACQATD
jgi:hypothetical protein